MKHFGTLYWYELKKLLKRKLAWIMVLVITAFMAYTARPVSNSGGANFSLTDWTGNTINKYVSVAEQRERISEGQQSINGQVMDERFFENVREASNGNGLYIWRSCCGAAGPVLAGLAAERKRNLKIFENCCKVLMPFPVL